MGSKREFAGKEEREALLYVVLAFLKGLVSRAKEWIAKSVTKEYNRVDNF